MRQVSMIRIMRVVIMMGRCSRCGVYGICGEYLKMEGKVCVCRLVAGQVWVAWLDVGGSCENGTAT